jgi:hypothetical protein
LEGEAGDGCVNADLEAEVDRLLLVAARRDAGVPLGTGDLGELVEVAAVEAAGLARRLPPKAVKAVRTIGALLAQRFATHLLVATQLELAMLDAIRDLSGEDAATTLHGVLERHRSERGGGGGDGVDV